MCLVSEDGFYQNTRHFAQTLDFACVLRMQNQGFEQNGEGIILLL